MAAADGVQTVEAEVVAVRWRADDGGFAVLIAHEEGSGEEVVLVGELAHLEEGDRVTATGRRREHARHGERFVVEHLATREASSTEAVEALLTRLPGVGPASAHRLRLRYDDELLARLEDDPLAVLRHVRGLSGAKLRAAADAWRAGAGQRATRLFLEQHGVDAATVGRVLRGLGDAPDVEALRADPYALVRLEGVGFATADRIALAAGEAPDSPRRRRAGVRQALLDAERDGHCHLPRGETEQRTARLLGADAGEAVDELLAAGDLVRATVRAPDPTLSAGDGPADTAPVAPAGDELVSLPDVDDAERELARRLTTLATGAPTLGVDAGDAPPPGLSPAPSAAQWSGVREALGHRVAVLTGGPGTGKTQTMRALVELLRTAGRPVRLCAPTGKAARRLAEATGADATTIHRLLGFVPGEGFGHDQDEPLEDVAMLVVDEASMLPLDLALALVRAVGPETHLLLVGDVDQLAPVGAGRVLADVLDSGVVPAVRLTEIFRQAVRSLIVRAAHAMNEGRAPETAAGPDDVRDFFLVQRPEGTSIAAEVESLLVDRLPKHYAVDAVGGVQALAPMRRGPAGVEELNRRLRERLNPGGDRVPGSALRTGDRVLQTKNDHERELMNGELGMLVSVGDEHARLAMDDGRRVSVPYEALRTWELAYACTVHKAQGSSMPVVVVVVDPAHRHMLTRNLLYTAITRAERACVVVGDAAALRAALRRVDGAQRRTLLGPRLRAAVGA